MRHIIEIALKPEGDLYTKDAGNRFEEFEVYGEYAAIPYLRIYTPYGCMLEFSKHNTLYVRYSKEEANADS